MPVAALMEKVGLAVFAQLRQDFPHAQRIGILCGTGHNGGDGLVVGRELRLAQKGVKVWLGKPDDLKPLTADHARYLRALGAEFVDRLEELADCDLLIDALFGIGLNRPLGDPWARGSGVGQRQRHSHPQPGSALWPQRPDRQDLGLLYPRQPYLCPGPLEAGPVAGGGSALGRTAASH
jgi:hypothetical protein